MKAIVYRRYGTPDVLELAEVSKPIPHANEVLVRAHAACLNSWDVDFLKGASFMARVWGGLRRPKHPILGTDIAGEVEAVGEQVTTFHPGDVVFGEVSKRFLSIGWGAFAEYACVRENSMAIKPPSMTFEEAASIPQVAALALGGLRYNEDIQPTQSVLINGAEGGVGTFAIQIAKTFGAEITGVGHTDKLDILRSIGADRITDYTQEGVTQNDQRYDLIRDVAAYRPPLDYKRALSRRGAYCVIGGSQARFFQTMFLGLLVRLFSRKKVGTVGANPNGGVDFILKLFEAGKIVPVIDQRDPLSEVAEAFRYFGEGGVKGKIAITI